MEINIKDQELAKQICFQLNIPPTSSFNQEDLLKITELNIDCETITGNMNPVYIEDLAYFRNLKELSLIGLKITKNDFNYIANLQNLTNLDFYSCNLESVKSIKNLSNLRSLSFTDTFLKDFSPLSTLKNIQYLKLSALLIINLNFLTNMKKLKILDLINLKCMDISGLKTADTLEEIYLDGIRNLDLNFLTNCTNLKKLSLSSEQLENNSELIKQFSINKIQIYKNQFILLNPEVSK